MNNKIKVLIVEPGRSAYTAEIESDLKSLQKIVGGLIQAIYPYDDPVALICNAEGKLLGLPLNRPLIIDGQLCDIIVGTFLIVGLTDESFGSLDAELLCKYKHIFDGDLTGLDVIPNDLQL